MDGGRALELCADVAKGEIVVFDCVYADFAHRRLLHACGVC